MNAFTNDEYDLPKVTLIRKMSAIILLALLMFSPAVFGHEHEKDKDKKNKKEKSEKSESLGGYARELPSFDLKDPAGKAWTKESVAKEGVVLVVTAPILKNKGAQENWSDQLLASKAGAKAKLVYIEDMKPSIAKGMALKGMKKEYKEGKEPILLIDNDGNLRKKLKVPSKKTVVLVYDNNGKLIYADAEKPSKEAAHAIWKKVK